MKNEYVSPEIVCIGLKTGDIMNLSIGQIAGDIGDNPDGNAMFGE